MLKTDYKVGEKFQEIGNWDCYTIVDCGSIGRNLAVLRNDKTGRWLNFPVSVNPEHITPAEFKVICNGHKMELY